MADDGKVTAELAAIKERVAKASPGPWATDTDHGQDVDGEPFTFDAVVGPDGQMAMETVADLEFAAHAREDVPRLVKALEAALSHHDPDQLHGMVEDYKGNIVCPHGSDYDGDLHYEDSEGFWYCKALPTVVVCSSCADGSASDLREQWPCSTYTGITSALTGTETT